MNFKTDIIVSLPLIKAFVYEAKQHGFAATDTKTSLLDQTSAYSYRPFADARFAGMIYADIYNGNTIEGGQESVTIDLVLRWRNQYYGGTSCRFWNIGASNHGLQKLNAAFGKIGPRFPEVVSAFLKQALMRLPLEFPVRGPREYRAVEVKFEGAQFSGDWLYTNTWQAVPLFDTDDPFASYVGHERISLNRTDIYWHAYQGGIVRDKYFPLILQL